MDLVKNLFKLTTYLLCHYIYENTEVKDPYMLNEKQWLVRLLVYLSAGQVIAVIMVIIKGIFANRARHEFRDILIIGEVFPAVIMFLIITVHFFKGLYVNEDLSKPEQYESLFLHYSFRLA